MYALILKTTRKMLTLVSPSKTVSLAEVPQCKVSNFTTPQYSNEAAIITGLLKTKSIEQLAWTLNCSYGVAEKQKVMLENWYPTTEIDNGTITISVFDDFNRSIDLTSWKNEDFEFIQDKMGILSSLYGYLRPLDIITPYVLPMDTILHTTRGKRIFEYWEAVNSSHLEKLLKETNETEILNLLTVIGRRAIKLPKTGIKIYEVTFAEIKNGKKNNTASWRLNKVRSNLVEYIAKNKIDKADKIKKFEFESFKYSKELSHETQIFFVRNV